MFSTIRSLTEHIRVVEEKSRERRRLSSALYIGFSLLVFSTQRHEGGCRKVAYDVVLPSWLTTCRSRRSNHAYEKVVDSNLLVGPADMPCRRVINYTHSLVPLVSNQRISNGDYTRVLATQGRERNDISIANISLVMNKTNREDKDVTRLEDFGDELVVRV
ncbi:hypothetical protein PanWU01x14_223990 [Parasponia andersonii]|uniref:Uncharacterized protein n=1 Tax=Parasponia andersonii TaxID=3476 RepID=A0A2P5BNH0_PARAD|nr:hypothetical protein PanWU01x14_223990 [Parasponia andersonii]